MDSGKIILAAFVCLVAVQAAPALALQYTDVRVANMRYDPYPAEPGKYFDLYVQLSNVGTIDSKAVTFTLQPQFPFTLDSDSPTWSTPLMAAGGSALLQYHVRVSPDAISGPNKLSYTVTDASGVTNANFVIEVARASNVRISDVTPVAIQPGQLSEMALTISNDANSTVNGIGVSWAESSRLIVPVGSENRLYIDSLGPYEKKNVTFDVMADPAITPGAYILNISISFNNGNTTQTTYSNVGLIAGGDASIEADLQDYTSGTLSVAIANVGTTPASAVSVSIPRNSGLTLNGAATQFLGNLLKGDFTVASFQVSGTAGSFNRSGAPAAAGQGARNFSGGRQFGGDNSTAPAAMPNEVPITISYTDTLGVRRVKSISIRLPQGGGAAGAAGAGLQRRTAAGDWPWYAYFAAGFATCGVIAYAYLRFVKKKKAPAGPQA